MTTRLSHAPPRSVLVSVTLELTSLLPILSTAQVPRCALMIQFQVGYVRRRPSESSGRRQRDWRATAIATRTWPRVPPIHSHLTSLYLHNTKGAHDDTRASARKGCLLHAWVTTRRTACPGGFPVVTVVSLHARAALAFGGTTATAPHRSARAGSERCIFVHIMIRRLAKVACSLADGVVERHLRYFLLVRWCLWDSPDARRSWPPPP